MRKWQNSDPTSWKLGKQQLNHHYCYMYQYYWLISIVVATILIMQTEILLCCLLKYKIISWTESSIKVIFNNYYSKYFNLLDGIIFHLKFQSCLELCFPASEATIFCNNKNTGVYYLFVLNKVINPVWDIWFEFMIYFCLFKRLIRTLHTCFWKSVVQPEEFVTW